MMRRIYVFLVLALALQISTAGTAVRGNSTVGFAKPAPTQATATHRPAAAGESTIFESLVNGRDYVPNPANAVGDFQRLLEMPFKLKDLPADVAKASAELTPGSLAKSLVRGGAALGATYALGEAASYLLDEACLRLRGGAMVKEPGGTWEECKILDPEKRYEDPLIMWKRAGSDTIFAGPSEACKDYPSQSNPSNWYTGVFQLNAAENQGSCQRAIQWPGYPASYDYAGTISLTRACKTNGVITQPITINGAQKCEVLYYPDNNKEWVPTTDDKAEQKLKEQFEKPANRARATEWLTDHLRNGGGVELDDPRVTGPQKSPSSVTTTTSTQQTANGPMTVTTTTTTVINYTYNISNVTAREVTNTVVRDPDGKVISETDTEDEPQSPPVDTDLPPIPKLYERKYPDGIVGIWKQKKEAISQTSLFSFAGQMMPTSFVAGTCPSWQVDLSFQSWADYGVHTVAIPCWIWDVAKGIIIVSALILARALIFGGKVAAFFTMLFAKIAAVVGWFGKLAVAVFQALWDFIRDSACWPFEQVMEIVLSAISAIDLSGLSNQIGAWGTLPAELINILGLLGVGIAASIIVAAIGIRLVLQLIPFTRLGS